jgi:hypothetical protein
MTSILTQPRLTLRHKLAISLSALGILFLSPSATAQTPLNVDEAEAKSHLQTRVEPIYPPMAKALHNVGQVEIQIDIDPEGHVAAIKPLSGSPMLLPYAIDALREWTYAPFTHEGAPIEARTIVKLEFTPGMKTSMSKEAQDFGKQLQNCNEQLRNNDKPAGAIAACQKAAQQADNLSGPYYTGRRMAYIYYATALLRGHQAKESVLAGERAIAFTRRYYDDSSAAYAVTGQAKAVSGDLAGADSDLETAEQRERKWLDEASLTQRPTYLSTLKSLLQLHAQVLTGLSKPADAQKKLDEASKL